MQSFSFTLHLLPAKQGYSSTSLCPQKLGGKSGIPLAGEILDVRVLHVQC